MLRKVVYSLTLSLSLSLAFWSIKDFREKLEDVRGTKIPISVTEPPVRIFARVGGYMINLLSGWTSPYAEVNLSSLGLVRKTTADAAGYFEFNFIPVPENIGEICLIAQDVNQLPTFPTCLAPPPRNMNLEIKDVLLSPSISLESGAIPVGRTTKASGMTFPDSGVEVYLFTEPRFSLWARIEGAIRKMQYTKRISYLVSRIAYHVLPKSSFALGLPIYKIRSNSNGYFEFSLPANTPSVNRVYAVSILSNLSDLRNLSYLGKSPKSNTLSFRAVGLLGILGMFLKEFFRQALRLGSGQAGKFFFDLKNDPLIIILIEILILLGICAAIVARRALEEKKSKF